MGFVYQNTDILEVLKSKSDNIEWELKDIQKGREGATVVLAFRYEEKMEGTVDISMIKEDGEWKIDSFKLS